MKKSVTKKWGGSLKFARHLTLLFALVLMLGTKVYAAVEIEPNNSSHDAQQIEVNTEYLGVVSSKDDIDIYKVNITQPGVIYFTFRNEFINSNWTGWHIDLIGPNNTKFDGTDVFGNNTEDIKSKEFGVGNGTYYIKIVGANNGFNVNYHLTVNFTASNEWEAELNDKTNSANELSSGEWKTGNLYNGTDVDYYKIIVPQKGKISFNFRNESAEQGWRWTAELLGLSDYKLNSTSIEAGNTDTITSPEYGVIAGTYYLKVSGYIDYTNYHVKLNYSATEDWEAEPNDTADKATDISVNCDIHGNAYKNNDNDFFKVTLQQPGQISLKFKHDYVDSDYTYNVKLIDTTGNNLFEGKSAGKNRETLTSETYNASAGTYLVKIEGNYTLVNLPYTLRIDYSESTLAAPSTTTESAVNRDCVWEVIDGKSYWYENNVRQGTLDDPNGVLGDGTVRGREIYDPASNAWYWLDSIYNGAKACGKEVWMPYIYQDENTWDDEKKRNVAYESDAGMGECVLKAITEKTGKWVRYDENGHMLKGWVKIEGTLATLYPEQAGNTYYYDNRTGLMAKGQVTIDGKSYYFDEITGVLK